MSDQKSYTKFENELVPQYRKQVGAAGSVEEVKKCFARTVCELLARVSDDAIRCRHEDVVLTPANAPYYTLSPEITAQPAFQSAWAGSDLPAILHRLVDPAVHRHTHLAKHPEKTNTNNYIHH